MRTILLTCCGVLWLPALASAQVSCGWLPLASSQKACWEGQHGDAERRAREEEERAREAAAARERDEAQRREAEAAREREPSRSLRAESLAAEAAAKAAAEAERSKRLEALHLQAMGELRFFESGAGSPPSNPIYGTDFRRTSARVIYTALRLSYRAPGVPLQATVQCDYHTSLGAVIGRSVVDLSIAPAEKPGLEAESSTSVPYGWDSAGHWTQDQYWVDCRALGHELAHGYFFVFDDRPLAVRFAEDQKMCDGGNMGGCYGLGAMYEAGSGVPRDSARAVALYQKACDGGFRACDDLIRLRDGPDAQYRKACDNGEMLKCDMLASMYEQGSGVPRDAVRAATLYQKACDGIGDELAQSSACRSLGAMYEEGSGVPRDTTRAAALYQRACGPAGARACALLGDLYERGSGVARDAARALALYQEACDHGSGCRDRDRLRDSPSVVVDIPGLKARVVGLRFYESGAQQIPGEQVLYSTRFDAATARYIRVLLRLVHPAIQDTLEAPETCTYFNPAGQVWGQPSRTIRITPMGSWTSVAWGWATPGHWTPGTYRVECSVSGRVVANETFTVQ